MPKKKKTLTKSSHTPQSKTGSLKSFKLKPWHILTGIALFVVGGFVVAFSQAATSSPYASGDIIASYADDSGVLIQQNDGSVVKTLVAPSDVTLSSNGDLFCYEANADVGTTRRLTPDEISQLLTSLKATGVTTPPVSTEASQGAVVFKGLTFQNPTTGQDESYNVLGDSEVPAAFSNAAGLLKAACAGQTKPLKRIQKPALKSKNPRANANPTTSFNVLRALTQTAHAAVVTTWANQLDVYLISKINAARASSNLPAYALQPCLQRAAQDWSSQMADRVYNPATGTLAYFNTTLHNQDLFGHNAQFGCSGTTAAGENIGYWAGSRKTSPDAAANELFTRYMNSAGHRAAILSTMFNRYHVGSAETNDGNFVFNTQRFIAVPANYGVKK